MRAVILLASVLLQACIGGLYAWSSFIPALRNSYGLSTAQTQMIFGDLIAVFTLSMVYAGGLLDRRGPRWVAGVGGVLFASGYLTASVSGGNFLVMLFGISLLAGIGTGFCYVCALAMCVGWFPSRKGLATGIAVAGFGGGAVLLSCFAETLFSWGMDVLTVFRCVGIVYGLVILGAALLLAPPPCRTETPARPVTALGILLSDRFFWALVVGMFCGTSAGLLVIGNLRPMSLTGGLSPAVGVAAISAFAVGNACGRIAWGWISDQIGLRAIPLSLATLAAGICGMVPWSKWAAGFTVLSAVVGFGFGGCFVTFATQTASRYGADVVGRVYPLVFLAYGLAGVVGPWVGGRLYDATLSYTPAVATSVVVVLIGLLLSSRLFRQAAQASHNTTTKKDALFVEEV